MGCGEEGSCVIVYVSYWVLHCCRFPSSLDFVCGATVDGSFRTGERNTTDLFSQVEQGQAASMCLVDISLQRLRNQPSVRVNRVDVEGAPTVVGCTPLRSALAVGRLTVKTDRGRCERA